MRRSLPIISRSHYGNPSRQSLLINPNHATTYLRLAELLLVPLKEGEHAVSILTEARRRYPDAPEFAYYLAIALRESKQAKPFNQSKSRHDLSAVGGVVTGAAEGRRARGIHFDGSTPALPRCAGVCLLSRDRITGIQ